jgi:hypothetical protein
LRDARIFHGKTGTIAHLNFISAIIGFGVKVQIVEVGGNVMSCTSVGVPVEVPGLRWASSVGCKIGPCILKGMVKPAITS